MMASEDKRLKNRLAQRKYRTNMKKRLEDLERLAAAAGHPQPTNPSNTGVTKQPTSALLSVDEDQDEQGTAQQSLPTESPGSTQPSSGVVSVTSTADFIRRSSDVDSAYGTNDSNIFHSLEDIVSLPSDLGGNALGNGINGRDLVSAEHQSLSCQTLGSVNGYNLGDVADFTLPGKSWEGLNTGRRQHSFHTDNGLDPIDTGRKDPPSPTMNARDWQRDRMDSSFGSLNLQQPLQPRLQASPEQRIEYVMRCARDAGFEDLDSVFSYYFTEHFVEGTDASSAQGKSRSRTLPSLTETFRTATKSWSPWDANAYKDALIRCAERIIAEEFERLERKVYTSEIEMMNRISLPRQSHNGSEIEGRTHREELHLLATEIEENLKNELPNLWGFITGLTKCRTSLPREAQAGLVLATMKILAHPGDELITEATDWTRIRAASDTIPERKGSR